MNAHQLAKLRYASTNRDLGSDKSVEIHVFADITARLRKIDAKEIGSMTKLAEALNDNVKLWNILLVDVTRPENGLPHSLKTSIISLAEFTQSHTLKVLAGDASQDVLIDINKAVLSGLKASLAQPTIPSTITTSHFEQAAY